MNTHQLASLLGKVNDSGFLAVKVNDTLQFVYSVCYHSEKSKVILHTSANDEFALSIQHIFDTLSVINSNLTVEMDNGVVDFDLDEVTEDSSQIVYLVYPRGKFHL